MDFFLAQTDPRSIWNAPFGSGDLKTKIAITLIVGIAAVFGLLQTPPRYRRPLVSFFVFITGLYYVLILLWPAPIGRNPEDKPRGAVEAVGFWLNDAQGRVTDVSNVLAGFLLGLGIYSLVRIHGRKVIRQQKDWVFSLILLSCVVLMAVFGTWDWWMRNDPGNPKAAEALGTFANWQFPNLASDFLFDGLLQQMDSVMFSLIAFYILSAAYRAFRVRSVEATILLATALILILSAMGAVQALVDGKIAVAAASNPFLHNFELGTIADWLRKNVQSASLRGIEFGVGIGLLSMGLRIWLSLERTGESQ